MAVVLTEKRQFPRIKLHSPLHYQIRGSPEFDNAACDDISSGGVSFTGAKFIRPDTLLMLNIDVLSSVLRPVGRITRSSPLPHSDRYRSGIEFLELDPTEKHYLNDYIDMRLGRL